MCFQNNLEFSTNNFLQRLYNFKTWSQNTTNNNKYGPVVHVRTVKKREIGRRESFRKREVRKSMEVETKKRRWRLKNETWGKKRKKWKEGTIYLEMNSLMLSTLTYFSVHLWIMDSSVNVPFYYWSELLISSHYLRNLFKPSHLLWSDHNSWL